MNLRPVAVAAMAAIVITAGCTAGQEKTTEEICAEDPERCARIDRAVANSRRATSTTGSYSSRAVRDSDPGDQACGFLRDSGPSGDPTADRMRRATLDNYCTGGRMSSNPDPCGYLRAAGPSGDAEVDRLDRATVNNYC